MTRIAMLCDTHFGARNDSKVFLAHQRRFFEEIFFPELESKGIDTILHLGDVFERRKYINFYTLTQANEFFFDVLREKNITMHTITGNHDTFFTTTNEINSINLLLSSHKNIHLYANDPVELRFGPTRILMCPWLTRENYESSMATVKRSTADILLGHFDLAGFEKIKGFLSDHGDDPKAFSHFEAVYTGHFHHGSAKGNIRYLGAQYEMNWSDFECSRGFYILDTNDRSLEFVENPNRVYHELYYDDEDLTIEQIGALDFSILEGCFVRVIVERRENPYLYDVFMEKLNQSGAADVKSVESSQQSFSGTDVQQMIDDVKDTRQIMHSYVDQVDTATSKQAIKTLIDDIYIEALNQER